uniref:Inactive phospholipase D5-like n=1 Tax=Stegastes partitus TaxID=144197 RepID=A0A3B5AT38_9TELE
KHIAYHRCNIHPGTELIKALSAGNCWNNKTQQKCIAVFALLCCFAVLTALIFSSVDIWGDDEDGITEENCSSDCSIVLVENIPDDLSLPVDGRPHLPLSAGFHMLLDQAKYSVEVVSPVWDLNSWDLEPKPSTAKQVQSQSTQFPLFSPSHSLKTFHSLTTLFCLCVSPRPGAEVHFVNMAALTRGGLHSSFWVVDRQHIYIGSANMDWRSLSKRKELGVVVYNCSCLALDLHRVFSFYWQLHERDYIPSIWSKRVTALYGRHDALELQLNATPAAAYVSTSPELFCAKDRTRDVDAIYQVIQSAKTFIFISVTDYLPLGTETFNKYWSPIDEVIREAVVLRGVRVRLLISFWKRTHPLTFNFVASLKSLCMQLHNCSLEVVSEQLTAAKEQKDDIQHGLNNNKYMVTDNAVYIGNHDWVGSNFAINAGVGLVVKLKGGLKDRGVTVLEQVKAAFERDWRSGYAKSLQGSRDQQGKYRNMQHVKNPMEMKEKNEWNYPLSL